MMMSEFDERSAQSLTEPAAAPPVELEKSTRRGQRADAWGWFSLVLGSFLFSGEILGVLYFLVEIIDGGVVVPFSWVVAVVTVPIEVALIAFGLRVVLRGQRPLPQLREMPVRGSESLPRPRKVPASVALLSASWHATLAALGVLFTGLVIADDVQGGGAAGAGAIFLGVLVAVFLLLCAVSFAVWMRRVLRGAAFASVLMRVVCVPLGFFFAVGAFALLFSMLLFVRSGLPEFGWSLVPVSLVLLVAAVLVPLIVAKLMFSPEVRGWVEPGT